MNPVRQLRTQLGMTQDGLARAAGTSQPTIAAYESGRKSPNVGTIERLASAVGLKAELRFSPPMTREERRSLALHHAIVARLMAAPASVRLRARRNLATMKRRHGSAVLLLREWTVVLNRPLSALCEQLTDTTPWSRELRHVTPFAGVLSARERAAVLRQFADDEAVAE